MQEKTGILFIQLIHEITYNFDDSLKDSLLKERNSPPYFEIDNLSDEISLKYALDFCKNIEHLTVVIQSEEGVKNIGRLNRLFYELKGKEGIEFLDYSKLDLIKKLL